MLMKISPEGAPSRNHSVMKHNPGRKQVLPLQLSNINSIEVFSQVSCSGYRPLKDIFPAHVRTAIVERENALAGVNDEDRTTGRSSGACILRILASSVAFGL